MGTTSERLQPVRNTADLQSSSLSRQLYLFLWAVALVYAFLAGLRTVTDWDLGWQLATGRWIVQHHQIPSTDVFSYTASGQPWIYPVGSGLIFYAIYQIGNYALLSWLGAAACVGTVALTVAAGHSAHCGAGDSSCSTHCSTLYAACGNLHDGAARRIPDVALAAL